MIQLKDIRPIPLVETPGGIDPQSQTFGTQAQFEKGKKYLVLAPSGKGKSTLLHIMYGLRKDYQGELLIGEKSSSQLSADGWADIRRSNISIVFQNLRLFPGLTALENIHLKNELTHHKSADEIIAMAKQLGILDCLDKSAGILSYGQRQRVAIIRALCQPFDMLLLDEPFSHLDQKNIEAACALIESEITAQQAGLILVSLGERYPIGFDEERVV